MACTVFIVQQREARQRLLSDPLSGDVASVSATTSGALTCVLSFQCRPSFHNMSTDTNWNSCLRHASCIHNSLIERCRTFPDLVQIPHATLLSDAMVTSTELVTVVLSTVHDPDFLVSSSAAQSVSVYTYSVFGSAWLLNSQVFTGCFLDRKLRWLFAIHLLRCHVGGKSRFNCAHACVSNGVTEHSFLCDLSQSVRCDGQGADSAR